MVEKVLKANKSVIEDINSGNGFHELDDDIINMSDNETQGLEGNNNVFSQVKISNELIAKNEEINKLY